MIQTDNKSTIKGPDPRDPGINSRKIETAYFLEARVQDDNQAYELYENVVQTLLKHGASIPQIPPAFQPCRLSMSTFFSTMPRVTAVCDGYSNAFKKENNRKVIGAAVFSMGVNRLNGGGIDVDGSYLTPCRPLLYNLRQRDMERFLVKSPACYVYTGMRLFDLLFKYLFGWVKKFEDCLVNKEKDNSYEDEGLVSNIIIDKFIDYFKEAIDKVLQSVWETLHQKIQGLDENEYHYCDIRTSLHIGSEHRLLTALDYVLSCFKPFFSSSKNPAIASLNRQIRTIKATDHPLYLPKGSPHTVYSPPAQTITIKEQLKIAFDNNERANHVLDASAAAGTGLSGVLLQPVFMALEFTYKNATALSFTYIGVGLTVASMLFFLIACAAPGKKYSIFIKRKEQDNCSINDFYNYKYQAEFSDHHDFCRKFRDNVLQSERVMLHETDYLLGESIITSARRRLIKNRLIGIAISLLILALCFYGSGMLFYIDCQRWGLMPLSIPLLILLCYLPYNKLINTLAKVWRKIRRILAIKLGKHKNNDVIRRGSKQDEKSLHL